MPPEPNTSAPSEAEAAPADVAAAAEQGMQLAGRPDVISKSLRDWKAAGVDGAIMASYLAAYKSQQEHLDWMYSDDMADGYYPGKVADDIAAEHGIDMSLAESRVVRRATKRARVRTLLEQPISGAQADEMAAAQKAAQDVKRQADMMAELDDIAVGIEEIAKGMYGMSGPGTVSGDEGDEMAQDLELQIERLTTFYRTMEDYFNAITG
jgi:hypothetical protein